MNEWNEHVTKVKWEKLCSDNFAHQKRYEVKEQKNSSMVVKRIKKRENAKSAKEWLVYMRLHQRSFGYLHIHN